MFYIDSDFKCHKTNPDGIYTEIDMDAFPGMCDAFVEGYLFIPEGQSTVLNGVLLEGEMLVPWRDIRELDEAQRDYERQLLAQYEQALSEIEAALGVSG